MDLKEKSLEQLKAMVYDEMVSIENSKNNISIINQEIANRITPKLNN
jgi:hypothetical protein